MGENITIKEIRKMYELRLVNDDTKCEFVHLYKGRYTYELIVEGKLYQLSNGFRGFESTHYLELARVMWLSDLSDCQTLDDNTHQ
jgi:hypothetical protein